MDLIFELSMKLLHEISEKSSRTCLWDHFQSILKLVFNTSNVPDVNSDATFVIRNPKYPILTLFYFPRQANFYDVFESGIRFFGLTSRLETNGIFVISPAQFRYSAQFLFYLISNPKISFFVPTFGPNLKSHDAVTMRSLILSFFIYFCFFWGFNRSFYLICSFSLIRSF